MYAATRFHNGLKFVQNLSLYICVFKRFLEVSPPVQRGPNADLGGSSSPLLQEVVPQSPTPGGPPAGVGWSPQSPGPGGCPASPGLPSVLQSAADRRPVRRSVMRGRRWPPSSEGGEPLGEVSGGPLLPPGVPRPGAR